MSQIPTWDYDSWVGNIPAWLGQAPGIWRVLVAVECAEIALGHSRMIHSARWSYGKDFDPVVTPVEPQDAIKLLRSYLDGESVSAQEADAAAMGVRQLDQVGFDPGKDLEALGHAMQAVASTLELLRDYVEWTSLPDDSVRSSMLDEDMRKTVESIVLESAFAIAASTLIRSRKEHDENSEADARHAALDRLCDEIMWLVDDSNAADLDWNKPVQSYHRLLLVGYVASHAIPELGEELRNAPNDPEKWERIGDWLEQHGCAEIELGGKVRKIRQFIRAAWNA